MKSRIFKESQGLSFLGIIITLACVGIAVSLTLSMYLSWITKGLAGRAMVTLARDRDQLEGCIQAHPKNEAKCQTLINLHSDEYFYYSSTPPQPPGSKPTEEPVPRNGVPDWNLYAWEPDDANYFKDYIELSRIGMYTISPKIICKARGLFSGICQE